MSQFTSAISSNPNLQNLSMPTFPVVGMMHNQSATMCEAYWQRPEYQSKMTNIRNLIKEFKTIAQQKNLNSFKLLEDKCYKMRVLRQSSIIGQSSESDANRQAAFDQYLELRDQTYTCGNLQNNFNNLWVQQNLFNKVVFLIKKFFQ